MKLQSKIDNRPLCLEVPFETPSNVFLNFSDQSWNMLFESVEKTVCSTNRYSYIAIDPFKKIKLNKQGLIVDDIVRPYDDAFLFLKQLAKKYRLDRHAKLPPFQGGLLGFLSYDLAGYYENIHTDDIVDDAEIMSVGFYDLVHAFDHQAKRSWVFSSGLPDKDRIKQAKCRLADYIEQATLKNPRPSSAAKISAVKSNFTREAYIKTVNRAIEYIKSGDVFEVNLSQRFEAKLPKDYETFSLYEKIKKINPSPFSAYVNLDNLTIISSSPERFIEISDGRVETRPIKGTRKRGKTKEKDDRLANELINSSKDRAENIMIVDLMRNDLSRVCEPDSINVLKLCGHEAFPHVHHLVSVIEGQLKPKLTSFDLLKAAFPGGSITGAPKIRAMQIIEELEPHRRGPYCGSLFWSSFDGRYMDSSILIRTYVIKGDRIYFHGGGAVTIDSNPKEEYEEALSKINALKIALELP